MLPKIYNMSKPQVERYRSCYPMVLPNIRNRRKNKNNDVLNRSHKERIVRRLYVHYLSQENLTNKWSFYPEGTTRELTNTSSVYLNDIHGRIYYYDEHLSGEDIAVVPRLTHLNII